VRNAPVLFDLVTLNRFPGTRPADNTPSTAEEDARRASVFREDGSSALPGGPDPAGPSTAPRNSLGGMAEGSSSKAGEIPAEAPAAAVQDPLAGMSDADKWGIKGLLALMGKYPSYNALVHGMDPAQFNLDMDSTE